MVKDLIFKTPEEEGLPSTSILDLIGVFEDYKMNLHSFMVVKNGNILAEGYVKPFDKDFQHRLYSASKTFVSMAIGKLIGEGKIRLTDKLAQLMPDLVETEIDEWLKNTTVEDALKMSVPMLTDTYFSRSTPQWAWTFFNNQKSLKPSGTIFNYNTSGTFILDVLIEKITGKTFLEYLRPEFDKIGISKDIWCVQSPDGYAWGGSGVMCTMRDFAKFAELIMNGGNYLGEQLLPKNFVEQATKKQICNLVENNYSLRKEGYGYQIWIHKEGFMLYGMGSQLAICFPDKQLMFVCNGDTQCNEDSSTDTILFQVREKLYKNTSNTPLPKNCVAYNQLKNKLDNLDFNSGFGEISSPMEEKINGATYLLKENPMGINWFRFDFTPCAQGKRGFLTYQNPRGVKKIVFGMEHMVMGTFPETHYYDVKVDTPSNRELNCLCSASWVQQDKILLRVFITDTCFGSCFMTFGFKGDEVGVFFSKRAEFFMDNNEYQGYAGGVLKKED